MKKAFSVMLAYLLWTGFSHSKAGEYVYLPEESIGDIRVSINQVQTMEVEWKKIFLLAAWGEIYARKPTYFGWPPEYALPGIRWVRGMYNAPRDIMVRVEKDSNGVIYTWSHSDFDQGYRQLNKVVATPNHISADTILEFTKDIPEELVFYPAVLPGEPVFRGESRQSSITNKEFVISRKDGSSYPKVYADNKEAFNWLEDDTQSLKVSLQNSNLTFSFLSNDQGAKLSFAGNAYLAIGGLAKRRGIIGIWKIHPRQCNPLIMHVDIALNSAVAENKPLSRDEFEETVPVELLPSRLSKIYLPEDKVSYSIVADNRWSSRKRDLKFLYEVINYNNEIVAKGTKEAGVEAKAKVSVPLDLPLNQMGVFNLVVTTLDGEQCVSKRTSGLARIPRPVDIPAEESFFGCDRGPLGDAPEHGRPFNEKELKNMDALCEALYNLGIREVRKAETQDIPWAKVEAEPGKYWFHPGVDQQIDTIVKHKMEVRWTDLFSRGALPSWVWKDGRTFKWEARDSLSRAPKIPHDEKEWALYENYAYQLAKHFKGRIKYYELVNEPAVWDPIHNEYTEALSKGVRRADPEEKIVGCATGGINLDYIKRFLEYKDGFKYVDLLAPHYLTGISTIMTGIGPEDGVYTHGIEPLIKIADKYNLPIWDGEAGPVTLYKTKNGKLVKNDGCFPLGRFDDRHKTLVNYNIRSILVMKSFPEIKRNSLCFAACYFGGGFYDTALCDPIAGSDYLARSFWGIQGHVLPLAPAHANLARLIDGRQFKERIRSDNDDFYCFHFTRGKENIAVLWMKKGEGKYSFSLPEGVEYIDLMGNARKASGKQEFTISEEPFYLYAANMDEKKFAGIFKDSLPAPLPVIEKMELSRDGRELIVSLRSFAPEKIKADWVTVSGEGYTNKMEAVKLRPSGITPVAFKLKGGRESLLVQVSMKYGDKLSEKKISLFKVGAQSCLEEDLTACWPFDEGSGQTAYDKSGNKNNGTIYGAKYVKEGERQVLQFDGDDYVNCGNKESFNFGPGNFTIEAWFKTDLRAEEKVGFRKIISKWFDGDNRWYIHTGSDGLLSFFGKANGIGFGIGGADAKTRVVDNKWHHLAVIIDKRGLSYSYLYLDGAVEACIGQIAAMNQQPNWDNKGELVIGNVLNYKSPKGEANSYKGCIGGIRIYNRALTDEEIEKHYKGGL